MSKRRMPLENGEIYHIFNRGVEKRQVFMDQSDYRRFIQSMTEFNTTEPIGSIYENSFRKNPSLGGEASKLVNIICYCLNPNHYHLILEQTSERGIEKFMHRLATGYTGYFNKKEDRSGVLFQGPFKSVYIGSNEQLLHASVYVNLNFKVHQLGGEASKSWSSWDEYAGDAKHDFCDKNKVLGQFKNKAEYKEFAEKTLVEIVKRKEFLKDLEE